ncbi:MAG TPA: TetR/AcrR family transcriptional regulator [Pseudonocardia sp.]|jgi:AcrR family transcriptional regulator|uniref:TetR/AcrR family transcriptional regulator n=1 Tax=Pseudonocardia sp. TaxID=60912 RepID=UPI002B4B0DA8|nr:TetR/AcrR family transcriptional regulator [Pseudonocardia sp.]HLU55960.1 TetR/AcrR family transcriptional regulator [Pseudonocardia sp.]
MPQATHPPSARQVELLDRAYRYVLEHGISELSLRPLAAAIGSSPRVLLYLFESKDGLIRALLARAREDELALLERVDHADNHNLGTLTEVARSLWGWLVAPEHRALLRLWVESYSRSLIDPDGPWGGFARSTVDDWLAVLGAAQAPQERRSEDGEAERTLVLAVLRGALLDLLATGDVGRTTAAVNRFFARAEKP